MEEKDVLKIIDALIERFDKIEDDSGADFQQSKKIILRWFNEKREQGLFK